MGRRAVTTCELPKTSGLHAYVGAGDFLDCYSVPAEVPPRRAAEIITAFPRWAKMLLLIRKAATAPFGLANDVAAADKVGIFPVESETGTEVIAGFDDRHLNFRVSVMSEEGRVYLATWVHPHNFGGRFYLKAIMPFHILISRDALRRVAVAEAGSV